MKRLALVALVILIGAGPLLAKTRKEVYPMPCAALWPALKDTVRNSGNYAVIFIDNTEMIATFAIGAGGSVRIDSAVLNAKGDTCEMQVQPLPPGFFSDDAGDLKKRVDDSLQRMQSSQPPPPAKTDTGVK
jgi:hypothetical protein